MTFSLSGPACVPCESRKNFRSIAAKAFQFVGSIRLPKIALLAAFCSLAMAGAAMDAAAQDQPAPQAQPPVTSVGPPIAVPYNPPVHAGFAENQWQIAEGYQYNRIYFPGIFANSFDTNGFNSSVTRFFGRDLGVEGDLGAGFAPSTQSASAASLFLGGGLHISFRGRSRFEPWGHGLIGVQHYEFSGIAFPANTTSLAWIAGGGLDYRFGSAFALRFQVDYLGSHFDGFFQRNLQIGAGIVWNF
jgi:opacity protein-like surface antigen